MGTALTNQNFTQEENKSTLSQRILAVFPCRIFCLPVCDPKI